MAYFYLEVTHDNLLVKLLQTLYDSLVYSFCLGQFSFLISIHVEVTVIYNNRQNFMGYFNGLMSNEVS